MTNYIEGKIYKDINPCGETTKTASRQSNEDKTHKPRHMQEKAINSNKAVTIGDNSYAIQVEITEEASKVEGLRQMIIFFESLR